MKRIKGVLTIVISIIVTLPVCGQFTPDGLEGRTIRELKSHQDMLYAGTDSGLYRKNMSVDTTTWKHIGLESKDIRSFVVFSKDSLLAGVWELFEQDSVYLYKTNNGGNQWETSQNGFGADSTHLSVKDMDQVGIGGDTLFAVSGSALYRSVNKGQSWSRLLQTGNRLNFVNAAFDNEKMVYTGGQNGSEQGIIWRSSDAGQHWTGKVTSDQVVTMYYDLIAHPNKTNKVFAASHSELRSSDDRGDTWRRELFLRLYGFRSIAFSSAKKETVYAGGENRTRDKSHLKLYKSSDLGENWGVISDTAAQANDILSIFVKNQSSIELVYLGTNNGIYTYDNTTSPTPLEFKPKVKIASPADSSAHFYKEETNQWYQGVELSIEGYDKDGEIVEYGWAIDNQSYSWTTQNRRSISPEQFGSSGSYNIRVTARDEDSLLATPDTAKITLVRPSLDQGILIVDETKEGEFEQLTDSEVDSLYTHWLQPGNISRWDIADKGMPALEELGQYKFVYWHADHWYGSSTEAYIFKYRQELAEYMDVGGNFILSGWKTIKALHPTGPYPLKFSKDDFANKYFGIQKADYTGVNPPGDMVGATGLNGFPDIAIDSSRVQGYPANFHDYMVGILTIEDSAETVTPIYSYRCRENCDNSSWKGTVVAQINKENHFQAAIVGFPFTFIKEQDANDAIDQLLTQMGYEGTSIPPRDKPAEFALRQNFPNPFNPTTQIDYSLPKASNVKLTVYDVLGRRVATLVDGKRQAGQHSVTFDAGNLSSGVYIYRLKADGFSESKKMLLMK